MSISRAAHLGVAVLATFLVRVLVRFKPQRWCPPAISLRLFRLSSQATNAITTADLRRRVPAAGWTSRTDLSYGPGRFDRFDLAVPDRPGPHPLVVWVHGGGWHFGDKRDVLPYGEMLAARGFAVAAVNYPLAPRVRYPAAPDAVRAALNHLREHAAELDLDPERIVLAGNSVGAQIVSELAVSGTSPLRGLVLFCGIYDPVGLDDSDRMFEAVLESAMWSVTRSRHWQHSPVCAEMTVVDKVTADFPPTFLSGGNQDPLFRRQTPPMAQRLHELEVAVEEFYPGDEAAPCFHEYQTWLGTPAGAEAFERVVAFLERNLGS
ncbi:alpha/beta hydrolase [Nocardioides marmorisolisilvae]|uniref:alpha/beta hydrolase n=1 Tax=Nocardioides marmorisolisilvae TaxID=1542737 RepID=UPI0016138BCB|nr:alpha/beta hydrolase [Nocardioides marmorisolisilvae]